MNNPNNERITDLIARIKMFGHGAGYSADEVLSVLSELLAYREAQGNVAGWKWRLVDVASGETSAWRVCLLPLQPGGGAGFETESIPLFAAPQLPAVPDGFALVSIEPTEDMVAAAWREAIGKCDHETINLMYKSMLAESPSPGVGDHIECWSCHKVVLVSSVIECDGYCPCCEAPIDFEVDD